MAWTPTQSHKRRIYIRQVKEAAFASEVADPGSYTHYIDPISMDQLRHDQRILTDANQATGREFPRQETPTERSMDGSIQMWLDHQVLGLTLGYGLGSDTVTGAGTDKTHAFAMVANTGFPGSFSIEDHLYSQTADNQTDWELLGCYLDSFTLEWGTEDFVTCTWNIGGSGKSGVEATQDESAMIQAGTNGYFTANKTRVSIATASAEHDSASAGTHVDQTASGTFANSLATNLSEYAESFSLTYSNNYQRRRSGGMSAAAGIHGVQPVLTRRDVRLQAVLNQQESSSFVKALYNSSHADNAEWTINIEFVSDVAIAGSSPTTYYSALLIIPLVGMTQTPASSGPVDGLRTETMEFYAKDESGVTDLDPFLAYLLNATTGVYSQA